MYKSSALIMLLIGHLYAPSEERIFMEEIQRQPCLYDKFNKNYKNKFTRLNAWKKVA